MNIEPIQEYRLRITGDEAASLVIILEGVCSGQSRVFSRKEKELASELAELLLNYV